MVTEVLPNAVAMAEARNFLTDYRSFKNSKRSRRAPRLVGADGKEREIPHALFGLLVTVAEQLESGNGIAIIPLHKELTTAEAAEILNMSRPHLIKLLDAKEIAFHKTGTHRRVLLSDALAYRAKRMQQFERAMEQMHQYDEDDDGGETL